MNEQNTFGYSASNTLTDAITRNRVLRNTFALLALTMVPTPLLALSSSWRLPLAFSGQLKKIKIRVPALSCYSVSLDLWV